MGKWESVLVGDCMQFSLARIRGPRTSKGWVRGYLTEVGRKEVGTKL